MATSPAPEIAKPTHSALSAAMKTKLARCKNLAASVDQADEGSRKALQSALLELYAFGQTLRKTPANLEEFVTGEGKPWNKTTRQNPYNALTQIIFPKRAKSRLSTYARALGMAHQWNYSEKSLSKELGPAGRGVEKMAKAAAKIEADTRAEPLLAALPDTKKRLAAYPDLRNEPEFTTIAGFAEVLVFVDKTGAFKIIDVLQAQQHALEGRLLRYAKPQLGEWHRLRQACQLVSLVPSSKQTLRIVSLRSDGHQMQIRAQGDKGILAVANLAAVDGFPNGEWLHFVAGSADIIKFLADADDGAALSSAIVADGDSNNGFEVLASSSHGCTKLSSTSHDLVGADIVQLRPDEDLGIAFAIDMPPAIRKGILNLGMNLQAQGHKVTLADGKKLNEKRNARIEFDVDRDSLQIALSGTGGSATRFAVPLDVIEKAPFSPLALSAGHFFQAFKHFDQFAGKGGVFIRGGGRLVELAAEVDGIDMSLVIPNPLELQRDTTPFCKLFPGKGDGEPVRLEAAE